MELIEKIRSSEISNICEALSVTRVKVVMDF